MLLPFATSPVVMPMRTRRPLNSSGGWLLPVACCCHKTGCLSVVEPELQLLLLLLLLLVLPVLLLLAAARGLFNAVLVAAASRQS
jgi:hypothetical protein